MIGFDYAVVGRGLIGAAATKYLSEAGARVVCIGPDEPERPQTHRGVFASHYDQGRLTRQFDRDVVYSKLAGRSIDAYPKIAAAGRTPFHMPVGLLVAESPQLPAGHPDSPLHTARTLGRRFDLYDVGDRSWMKAFPALMFPESYRILHEPAPAGYINPRRMLKAQLTIATDEGASIVPETVVRVRRDHGSVVVETDSGNRYETKATLVAAGAFTNYHDLVPRKLSFQPETESIVLARVSESDARQLARAPTVIYSLEDMEVSGVYVTPPILYPDGNHYIKIGANTIYDTEPSSLDAIGAWFRSGDSDRCKDALARVLRSMWPQVDFLSFHTTRCIICRTPNGYPIVDEVEDGLFVAAGGNGGAAKSADAIGRLAAGLMQHVDWPDELPREVFRAQYP